VALLGESPALTQASTLAVLDALVALVVEAIQDDTLAVADMFLALAAESPTLALPVVVTVVPGIRRFRGRVGEWTTSTGGS
jgi:hypothetical protein